MPEVDAEKLAAAKKKYEQLKKQKAKKAPAKKKDDKVAEEAEASTTVDKPTEAEEEAKDETKDEETSTEAPADEPSTADGNDEVTALPERPGHGRKPSLSVQSRMRSDSFRRGQGDGGPTSPTPASATGEGMKEIYKKQAARIDELERENKRLQHESREWQEKEEELERLREERGAAAGVGGGKGEDVEKLKTELATLQRQNAQLQSQITKNRRASTPLQVGASSEDLSSQLESKQSTIESLELELSSLHSQLTGSKSQVDSHTSRISTLEEDLAKAQAAAESAQAELHDLKSNLDKASEGAKKDGTDLESAQKRTATLEAEVSAAQRTAEQASKRTETLQKKIETLTTLHRDASAAHATKQRDHDKISREAKELRSRVSFLTSENTRLKAGDNDGVEELENEENARLTRRVRELEEEVFELRRGVWRDKRRELQPGIGDDNNPMGAAGDEFSDVDLGGYSPRRGSLAHPAGPYRGSSFTDVLQSGISAFVGGQSQTPNRRRQSSAKRTPNLGLVEEKDGDFMDDDAAFEFDEDAFRQAQEEEARKRVERVREVKRGLEKWRGWRVDLVPERQGMGGVFDI